MSDRFRDLPFHVYDVFTDRPFAGNPLAIVENADGLTAWQMQTIARQFNLSETIFVQDADDPALDARVRIFTPGAEIPFAGHPTVGCAIHLAGPETEAIVLGEVAGPVPVRISRPDGIPRAEFTAPRLPAPIGKAPDRAIVAAAVGLDPSRMGPHHPGAFEGGPAFLFAQVADLDALAQARPVEPGWSAMIRTAGIDDTGRSAVGLYLYTAAATAADLQARMFAPDDGIPEDPATGSATAILAGQLLANGALQDGTTTLRLAQGVEIGRPSQLDLTVVVTDAAPTAVRVAGSAVPVASGQIRCPGPA